MVTEYNHRDFRNQGVLKDLLQVEVIAQSPGVLADLIDPVPNVKQFAMAGFLYYQRHGHYPRKHACAAAMKLLAIFQRTLTTEVRNMRLESEQLQNALYDEDSESRIHEYSERQKPHAMGTVAEIAAKYGISKSEVRRLKAANSLHLLTEESPGTPSNPIPTSVIDHDDTQDPT